MKYRAVIGFWLGLMLIGHSFFVSAQDSSVDAQVHLRVYESVSTFYPEMKIYFSLLNRKNGRNLPVTQDNISATYEGQPVNVVGLESRPNTARRLNLVLCFDLTQSTSQNSLDEQKRTALSLIDYLDVGDYVAIVTQSDKGSETILSLSSDLSQAEDLINGLAITRGNSNSFYDGVNTAVSELIGIHDVQARSLVIVMTDVVKPTGNATPEKTIQLANEMNVPIYMIGYNDASREVLDEYTAGTSGFTYMQRELDADFNRLTRDILDFLNQEYAVTLESHYPADGIAHELKFSINLDAVSTVSEAINLVATSRPLLVTFPRIQPGALATDRITFEPKIVYEDTEQDVQPVRSEYILERSPSGDPATPLNPPDSSSPIFTWDLIDKPGGEYTVKLVVTDGSGNSGTGTALFKVASPLGVQFIEAGNPLENTDISPATDSQVEVEITGSYGISQVLLELDGQNLGTMQPVTNDAENTPSTAVAPAPAVHYVYGWDTSQLAPGPYQLVVRVADTRSNVAEDKLNVTITLGSGSEIVSDLTNIGIIMMLIMLMVVVLATLTITRISRDRAMRSVYPSPSQVVAIPPPAPHIDQPAAVQLTSECVACLRVIRGNVNDTATFPLKPGKIIIGRGKRSDIIVTGLKASRSHAEITGENGLFILRDLTPEKGNLTRVNHRSLAGQHILREGDTIQIGDTEMVFTEFR